MNTKVTVFAANQFGDANWPFDEETKLTDVIAFLKDQYESIPEQYRDETICNIDNSSYYDSTYATIEIYYERPETIQDQQARLRHEHATKDAKEISERAQLAALKAKYEKQDPALK